MKKIKIILVAILCGSFVLAIQSCKKSTTSAQDPVQIKTEKSNEASRMWATGDQLYAVGHDAALQAYLYQVAYPLFMPGTSFPFTVGSTQVTQVTGLAYINTNIIISTGPASNFPNQLLIYSTIPPYDTPIPVACPGISDIEFNEYDGKLYGVYMNNRIVRIAPGTGAITVNLVPTVPSGYKISGLCNYNGLLSYCISDATIAPDNFYAYNPGAPAITPALFITDWGTGNGGMHYCDGYGWEIITPLDNWKSISWSYVPTGFTTVGGGPYKISDLTSN